MSETKEELESSLKFYKGFLPKLESDVHHHVMSAYQAQEKMNEYKEHITRLEKEIKEEKDE